MGKQKKKDKIDGSSEVKYQLARALADYDNLRKRVEVEKSLWIKFSGERILNKLLPVLDILESAQKHIQDQGLEIAISEFKKVLEDEGLIEITAKTGDVFDANNHEAVELVEGGEDGIITELILPGWKFKDGEDENGGRVLRYAKVKVYKKNKN